MKGVTIAAMAALAALASAAPAAELGGRLELRVRGRMLRADELREAVVYFRPDRRGAGDIAAPPGGAYEMQTRGKQFEPGTLVVPVGATVRFPNTDPILHNVFSTSGTNRFDLGLYGRNAGRSHTFGHAGLVRVYCNVHHQMVGHILVLDTPHVTRPDADGRYRLALPDGARGELFVWHPRAPLWRQRVQGAGKATLDARIEVNRPLVPPHANKFGKPYEIGAGHGY